MSQPSRNADSLPGVEDFAAALAAFQAELPHVAKAQRANAGQYGYDYDYADLTDVTVAAMPLLSKHGLSFTASPTITEHGFVLRYRLLHTSGHAEGGDYPLPDPAKSSPQQIGSALTYGRRYSLCAVTGIAPGGDDDDGAKAADARSAAPTQQRDPLNDAKRQLAAVMRAKGYEPGPEVAADLMANVAGMDPEALATVEGCEALIKALNAQQPKQEAMA